MPPTNRTDQLLQIPLQQLLTDLLRQFNKGTLLGQHGIEMTKSEMDGLSEQLANRAGLPQIVSAINAALGAIVQESVDELQHRFGFTFAESLSKTDMGAIGGWETTSEFLEIANHKNNAELRISAGVSLMVFLGDVRYVDHLFIVMQHDNGLDDVDALIAKRALSYHTQVDLNADEWETQVREKLNSTL